MNLGKISSEMLIVMIGVFIVLVLSSLISIYLTKRYPEKDFTEIRLRIKSWWSMCIIFTIALVIHSTVSLIFLSLLCFSFERVLFLIPTNRSHRAVLFWAYLSIPIQFTFIYFGFYGMFIIFIPVYMFLFIPIQAILIGETKGFYNQWDLYNGA